MKEYYLYKAILKLVNDPMVALTVYSVLYQGKEIPKAQEQVDYKPQNQNRKIVQSSEVGKKKELEDSLSYLKSKSYKTKKDKESINIIETLLQNM